MAKEKTAPVFEPRTVGLDLSKETKNTVMYKAGADDPLASTLAMVYVGKAAFEGLDGFPPHIDVTISTAPPSA